MKDILLKMSFVALVIFLICSCATSTPEGPYLATGIKIGELTQSEAIVWVRLTINPERVGKDAPIPVVTYKNPETGEYEKRSGRPNRTPLVSFPEGYDITTIEGATPGSEGRVRLKYRAKDSQEWMQKDWIPVVAERAYAHQFKLSELSAGQAMSWSLKPLRLKVRE